MKRKIIVSFLFILFVLLIFFIYFEHRNNIEIQKELISKIELNLENSNNQKTESQKVKQVFEDGTIGILIIPCIDIKAPIEDGTDTETLKRAVRTF